MNQVCPEITTFSRACERLLSKEGALTEDERSLLEYYLNELSREFFSDQPTVRLRYRERVAAAPSPAR
jgi:hypothetical protein